MDRGGGADPFAELKEAGEEYKVYDSHYEKIGQVDDLIADEDGQVLYVGVKMGFFGTNSTLIPVEILRINDKRHLIEVSEPAETIKHAPHFGRSEELTPELENHVRTYFGLEGHGPSPEHESRDSYPAATETDDRVDTAPGERASQEHRSGPASGSAAPQEERSSERRPEHPGEHEPISERLSEEPSGIGRLMPGGGGVTVHRISR
jgi:hypothetical protein